MSTYQFSVVIDLSRVARVLYTRATYEEVLANIQDAIRLHCEDRLAAGEEIPQPDAVSLTAVAVAI